MARTEDFSQDSIGRMREAPVSAVLDAVEQAAQGDRLSVRRMFEALGSVSFLPLMLAPALAVVSPLSGIPGFSSLCGIGIALIAGQMLVRRRHLWAPDWLMRREIRADRARTAIAWLRRPAGWLEWAARPRLKFLVTPPLVAVLQLLCILAGLAMPFLELVPFSSSLLGMAVVTLSVAMLARDGLLALIGMAPFAAALAVIVGVLELG
ncbi:exopolysaccharide biosynthesis protein [Rhodovulum sulfidophilum]|uniref:exopolysaccharide biosynthesis protein n=2 Tax=Rhodovulum sulfidophilum TaxID=35806 RepID=UPI000AC450EB|nr:exopolysaccharide biosynthesis protein [Rhodovulum sulfidophilum]